MTQSIELQYRQTYRQIAASIINRTISNINLLDENLKYQIAWVAAYNQLLLALTKEEIFNFQNEFRLRSRIQRLNLLESETQQVVRNLLPLFEDADLPLVAIKSFLPFAYVDTNLDLLTIYPEKWTQYVKCLHSLGYRQFRNLGDLREPGKASYYKKDVELIIHLHSAVSWNGLDYLPLDQVLQRKQIKVIEGHPVKIPSPEDEMLIMAAHAIFENKYISLHELLYWHHLVQSNLDWEYMVDTAAALNWDRGFITLQSVLNQLAYLIGIGVTIPVQLITVPMTEKVWFPYILPIKQTFAVTTSKLIKDIRAKKWRQLPREIFSFSLVDGLWMYRKAYRKRLKVQRICS